MYLYAETISTNPVTKLSTIMRHNHHKIVTLITITLRHVMTSWHNDVVVESMEILCCI